MNEPHPPLGSQLFNVPNTLTAARLLLAVVVFVLISFGNYVSAMIIFIIAASTDWIDGYWARRYGQVTKVGRVFDPFVDKIIICGAFILLAAEPNSGIWAWMALVVVAREILVTALRSFIEQSGGDFSANMAGKLKMVFQCAAVAASLLLLAQAAESAPAWLGPTAWLDPTAWLGPTTVVLVWLAVISTVYSGVGYVLTASKHFR